MFCGRVLLAMVCQMVGQMVFCLVRAWWGGAACKWDSGRKLREEGSGSSCRDSGWNMPQGPCFQTNNFCKTLVRDDWYQG